MKCQVIGKLFEAIEMLSDQEKNPKQFGDGYELYPSELNFLDAVRTKKSLNSMELANELNVTRSAVTQMSKRLESKGLVSRFSKPDNKKEKYLELTRMGEDAIAKYDVFHDEANTKMCDYLSSLKNSERETIIDFLENLNSCMPITKFECKQKRGENVRA